MIDCVSICQLRPCVKHVPAHICSAELSFQTECWWREERSDALSGQTPKLLSAALAHFTANEFPEIAFVPTKIFPRTRCIAVQLTKAELQSFVQYKHSFIVRYRDQLRVQHRTTTYILRHLPTAAPLPPRMRVSRPAGIEIRDRLGEWSLRRP